MKPCLSDGCSAALKKAAAKVCEPHTHMSELFRRITALRELMKAEGHPKYAGDCGDCGQDIFGDERLHVCEPGA